MRPIVVRALTVALATGGVAWAVVLPSLTLGEARSPSHAFSIPASGGDIVIEASRPVTPAVAQPARIAARQATVRHAPTRAIIVMAVPARGTGPTTSPHPAAAAPKPAPAVAPKPLPSRTPAPQPQPQPAPEPPVRALEAVVVVEQPDHDSKQSKHKPHKQKKPKHEKAKKDDAAPPHAAPPTTNPVEPVDPVEPVAVDEPDQDEPDQDEPEQDEAGEDNDGKEHGSHGKGHDKKK